MLCSVSALLIFLGSHAVEVFLHKQGSNARHPDCIVGTSHLACSRAGQAGKCSARFGRRGRPHRRRRPRVEQLVPQAASGKVQDAEFLFCINSPEAALKQFKHLLGRLQRIKTMRGCKSGKHVSAASLRGCEQTAPARDEVGPL